jgi:hypothetical protein
MTGLRWMLGIVTGVVGVGWLVFVMGADKFRASFGAQGNAPLKTIVPVAVAILILATVFMPEKRLLLHITALVVAGILVASVLLARETVFVATVGVIYCLCWLLYYYRAVWSSPVSAP